ncbi:hypothetical protein JL857_20650 [Vibrio parahaemolyticus]|uniref:Uncharacterized protein n=1 Tax=Vibrio parahaemolyticus TaxID=670 RepID=A0A9Q3UG57_VIBPH|nr:hypothetical protein [Vibrio parahaemolyticus]MCC3807517.1 hypothetical protein [Vibrio parahaemolyticus]MCI9696485.1 hypothetical protein [Vibrio parahaemolyticus]MCI9711051.1 hypothetical protein [Vibrio parahaemolyticus]MCI9715931.1 hypothetical protein [Vibrio parahaemolyticus]
MSRSTEIRMILTITMFSGLATILLGLIHWKVSYVLGVPFDIVIEVFISLLILLAIATFLFYARYLWRIEIVVWSYPILVAFLWCAILPFLTYFGSRSTGGSERVSIDFSEGIAFYGEAWFQLSVLFLIFIVGYGALYKRYQPRW